MISNGNKKNILNYNGSTYIKNRKKHIKTKTITTKLLSYDYITRINIPEKKVIKRKHMLQQHKTSSSVHYISLLIS